MESSSLLPDKKQNGLLSKIKNIFRSIFYKQKKSNQNEENKAVKADNVDRGTSFMEDLKEKTDIKNAQDKENLEYIIETIEEKPELLEKLTTEQLEDVDNYYAEKIEEVDKEINKLKNKK